MEWLLGNGKMKYFYRTNKSAMTRDCLTIEVLHHPYLIEQRAPRHITYSRCGVATVASTGLFIPGQFI